MVSRDYTKEVGLDSGETHISKPLVVLILIVLGLVGWYFVRASSAPPANSTKPPAPRTP